MIGAMMQQAILRPLRKSISISVMSANPHGVMRMISVRQAEWSWGALCTMARGWHARSTTEVRLR